MLCGRNDSHACSSSLWARVGLTHVQQTSVDYHEHPDEECACCTKPTVDKPSSPHLLRVCVITSSLIEILRPTHVFLLPHSSSQSFFSGLGRSEDWFILYLSKAGVHFPCDRAGTHKKGIAFPSPESVHNQGLLGTLPSSPPRVHTKERTLGGFGDRIVVHLR